MHEVVDDLDELADRAALAHEVARWRVERHHAVTDAPAPLTFRIEPDDALHALADEPERPRLRIVVVVARVAQHEDRRLAVERVEVGLRELAERESEVRSAVIVDRRALERPFDRALDRIGVEGLGHLGDFGHEHVRADPAEALLKTPDQLQHEARGVADRVRHVADRDQLRLLPVPALEEDLHRHPAVLQALARGPPRIEAPLVLLPLAQRQRVLDLARQPRDHALHLGDFVGSQREERLVRQDLARELLALAVRAALQLSLDVLADHALERLEPELEIVSDSRQLARIEPARLERLHDPLEIALDGRPVELVGDPAREEADLQEVHEPLEAGVLPAGADGHLHLASLAPHEQLGQLVEIQVLVGHQLVEHVLDPRILRAERLLETFAERLEIEEVEVEEAIERRLIAELLDQGRGERRLERLAVGQADLGARGERVERLRGRDADLGPPEIADELEDALVHLDQSASTLSSEPLTRSRSFSCLTSIVRVDSTMPGSSSRAFRITSERAQSSDSETEGSLRRSIARIFWTAATTARASCSETSGTLSRMICSSSAGAGKSMKRCKHRRLSPSESSRALFEVSTTSGMCLARTVPSSGTETWKSESTSSRKASNSGSALSISASNSTTGCSAWIAERSGRGERKRKEKNASSWPAIFATASGSDGASAISSPMRSRRSWV